MNKYIFQMNVNCQIREEDRYNSVYHDFQINIPLELLSSTNIDKYISNIASELEIELEQKIILDTNNSETAED